MMRKKSDDAVSPVVGVMLMVVITVVVAGVIAAFGTGIAGDTEKAPSVVLDVKILSNFKSLTEMTTGGSLNGPDFHILQTSGDPLDTGEIEIQMAWTASDGEHYIPLGPRIVAIVLMPASRSVGMSRISLPCMMMHTSVAAGIVSSVLRGVMNDSESAGCRMHMATNISSGPIRNATNGTPSPRYLNLIPVE